MRNTGMLVANDINKDRVKALVGNFHRLGVTNSVITSENAKKFPKVWQYTPGQRTVTACSTAEQNAIFLIISDIEQNWNIFIIWYNFEGISCIQFCYICIGQLYHCCCLVHRKIKRKIPLLDIRFLQTLLGFRVHIDIVLHITDNARRVWPGSPWCSLLRYRRHQ